MLDISKRDTAKNQKTTVFSSFSEVASNFIEVMSFKTEDEKIAVMTFASYLNEKNTFAGDNLMALASEKAREIEKELMNALIDHIGVQKAQEIMLPIVNKYRNAKKK